MILSGLSLGSGIMTDTQFYSIIDILQAIQINLYFVGILIISLFCIFVAFYVVKFFLNILRKFL